MSICLTVYFYGQDLLYIDVNMVTEFLQLRNFTNKCKKKKRRNSFYRKTVVILIFSEKNGRCYSVIVSMSGGPGAKSQGGLLCSICQVGGCFDIFCGGYLDITWHILESCFTAFLRRAAFTAYSEAAFFAEFFRGSCFVAYFGSRSVVLNLV